MFKTFHKTLQNFSLDLFGTADTDMSDERHRVTTPYSESGAAPGLSGDYVDPHLKSHRDYESEYAKLAMQGGHKGKHRLVMPC